MEGVVPVRMVGVCGGGMMGWSLVSGGGIGDGWWWLGAAVVKADGGESCSLWQWLSVVISANQYRYSFVLQFSVEDIHYDHVNILHERITWSGRTLIR